VLTEAAIMGKRDELRGLNLRNSLHCHVSLALWDTRYR